MVATSFAGTPVGVALAGIGDSIIMGSTDLVVANASEGTRGNIGYVGRAAAGRVPYLNLGMAGTQAPLNQPSSFTRRAALLAQAGVNTLKCDWGTNDLSAGRGAAQIIDDIAAIAGGLKAAVPGARLLWTTITPRTSSSDLFRTAAGQTPFVRPAGALTGGAASVRGQLNAALRGGVAGVDQLFDAADVMEVDASNAPVRYGGRWIAGGGTPHLTSSGATTDAAAKDGLHPSTTNIAAPGFGGTYILRNALRTVIVAS